MTKMMARKRQQLSPELLGAVQSGLRVMMLGTERYRRVLAEQLGVTVTEVTLLGHLFNYGPMTPRAIADWLGFSTGATTAVIDRAAGVGYVTRTANPDDRRSVIVALTPGGQHALAWVFEQTNALLNDTLRAHSEDDLTRLAEVMRVVGEALGVATPVIELPGGGGRPAAR